jgi:hypothetical protein
VQPALMLGIVGGLLGYIIHDLASRRPRTTLRALAVTTLAVPLLIWLLFDSGLFAVLASIVASLAVYIKGRLDDRWVQQVALGGLSQANDEDEICCMNREQGMFDEPAFNYGHFAFWSGRSWDPRD